MKLSKWKTSWKQLKLQNSLPPLEIAEIESIIQLSEPQNSFVWAKVLMNMTLFLLLLIGLQGG